MHAEPSCRFYLRLTQAKATVSGYAQIVTADSNASQGYKVLTLHVIGEIDGNSLSLHGDTLDQLFGKGIRQCEGAVSKGRLSLSFPENDGQTSIIIFSPITAADWNQAVQIFKHQQVQRAYARKFIKAMKNHIIELEDNYRMAANDIVEGTGQFPTIAKAVKAAQLKKEQADAKLLKMKEALTVAKDKLKSTRQIAEAAAVTTNKYDAEENREKANDANAAATQANNDMTIAENDVQSASNEVANAENDVNCAASDLKSLKNDQFATIGSVATAQNNLKQANIKLGKMKEALAAAKEKLKNAQQLAKDAEITVKYYAKLNKENANNEREAETIARKANYDMRDADYDERGAEYDVRSAEYDVKSAEYDLKSAKNELRSINATVAAAQEMRLAINEERKRLTPDTIKVPLTKLAQGIIIIGMVVKPTKVMSRPDPNSIVLEEEKAMEELPILPTAADWFPVLLCNGGIGWVEAKAVRLVRKY